MIVTTELLAGGSITDIIPALVTLASCGLSEEYDVVLVTGTYLVSFTVDSTYK